MFCAMDAASLHLHARKAARTPLPCIRLLRSVTVKRIILVLASFCGLLQLSTAFIGTSRIGLVCGAGSM